MSATLAGFLLLGAAFLAIVHATGYPIRVEGLAYHLPIGVRILESSSLALWDSAFMHAYPANQSLYAGFLLLFLPERLVAAANVPLLIVLAAAIYALSRRLTMDKAAATVAAVGAATMPIVAQASQTIEADLSGLVFLTLAAYLVVVDDGSSFNRITLTGLLAGLAFGFKSLHLIGIAVLAGCILMQPSTRTLNSAMRSLASFAGGAAITSSFWLIRNYVRLGNPIYPVFVSGVFPALGWSEPPDALIIGNMGTQLNWVHSGWAWLLYPWREPAPSNLGPYFVLVGPVSILATAWICVRHRFPDRRLLGSMLLATLSTIAIWWLLGDRQPRYAMGALAFGGPLAGWYVSRLREPWRRRLIVSSCASILLAFGLSLGAAGRDLVRRVVLTDQSERHVFYQYPAVLDSLPPGSVVVNLGFDHSVPGNHTTRSWHYPLMGNGLRNRVVSFNEAVRLFAPEPYKTQSSQPFYLSRNRLRSIEATHLFAVGNVEMEFAAGLRAVELQGPAVNPVTGVRLDEDRVVYELRYGD